MRTTILELLLVPGRPVFHPSEISVLEEDAATLHLGLLSLLTARSPSQRNVQLEGLGAGCVHAQSPSCVRLFARPCGL